MAFLGRYDGSDIQQLANVSMMDDATADAVCTKFVIDKCNGGCDAATVTRDVYNCKLLSLGQY